MCKVSIPVFERKPDGTGWSGRIAYNWTGLRKHRLSFDFGEYEAPSIDTLYQQFGVCSALFISPSKTPVAKLLDPLYLFLYGHSIPELLEPATPEASRWSSPISSWANEPQEWTPNMVKTMDWDLFCQVYYAFLSSNNDFYSGVWSSLNSILSILKSDPNLLFSLLLKNKRNTDLTEFWETIYAGLQEKVIFILREESCYTAFHSLKPLKSILPADKYGALEKKCCQFLDVIARRRIDIACEEKYSAKELVDFDIELLFFYKDYFEIGTTQETKQYVYNAMFSLLNTKGDIFLENNHIISADDIYAAALKYSQTPSQRDLIASKRSEIASAVSKAREERAREHAISRLMYEKEEEKRKKKERLSDAVVKIMVIALLVCIPAIVIFGVLWLLGVARSVACIVFLVSFGVLVLIGGFCAIDAIHRKKRR